MKRILFALVLVSLKQVSTGQNVGIGTTTPHVNAALEIKSSGKGILMPRVSAVAKNGMTNVPKGMMVYDTTYSTFYYHDGNKWRPITDKNTDSLLTDYSSSPVVMYTMGSGGSITNALSGILYDNGGPAGDYAANSINNYTVDRTGNSVTDSVIGFKVIIQEMNLEAPYDSLEIYSDPRDKKVITGTTTGTYFFAAADDLKFRFRSNAVNNQAGFKILWTVLTISNTVTEAPPLYGWYFNARKLAVRGGLRNGNDWATDSLGKFSFAYGYNARATGTASVAFMEGNAEGEYSVSIGQRSEARGDYSVSLGSGGFWGANASEGLGSIALGQSNWANGYYARAIGTINGANGAYSIAIGDWNSSTNDGSIAFGTSNSASGKYALAMGNATSASGDHSVASGFDTDASGYYSTAMGRHSIASGDTSFATGYNTNATGNTSTAMGYETIASGVRSTSMGHSTTASGSYSTSMGYETISRGFAGTAIGMYNDPILGTAQGNSTSNSPLFIIGNGSSSATSNAMVVLKSGNIGIGTNFPDASLHIKHAGGGGLLLENENDGNKWRIYSASGDNNLTFYNNAGTEIADIDDVTGTFNALSDSRFKKDIQSAPSVLPLVMELHPKQYHFNWQEKNEQLQLGFLAQDAYRLFPQLVSYDKEKDLYKMNYAGFSTVAIKAIQEQQLIIQSQQQQIDELRVLVNQLLKTK